MRLTYVCLFLALALRLGAATPSAANLLPADTLALLSIPNWEKATHAWKDTAYAKLWHDPSLKAFREKLQQRWLEDLAGPLERQLGVKLADYVDLLQGQVALAITQSGWGTKPDAKPGFLLLIDSKDKQDLLKARLEELKKKWSDSGKQQKTEKIRDVEFTTFVLSQDELNKSLEKAFPSPSDEADSEELDSKTEPGKKAQNTQITFGQSGSLLIVGNSTKDLEHILARQSGAALGASLAEQDAFEFHQNSLFRDALGFGWVNFARVYEIFEKQLSATLKGKENGPGLRPDKILAALGLNGVRTIGARVNSGPDGIAGEVFVRAPEAKRKGLLKLLALEARDAGPPPFVGSDVVKFKRWRIDGQKTWTLLENTLASISPEISGLIQMGLQAAGKDKDPDFDLKKALVGNLGNDFISLEKSARNTALSDLEGNPSLFLIGTAHPDELIQGIKAATSLMPLAGGAADLKEREFLGRKIYTLVLPGGPQLGDGPDAPHSSDFSFAATSGYAAIGTDAALLESYLRTADTVTKPLREMPGLSEAAQRVGGTDKGFFGYENQAETVRAWLESSKQESAALDKLLSLAPIAGGKARSADEKKNVKDWLDVSLLPPFDRISKYFSFFVYSIGSNQEGLSWKLFVPTPPQLR